MIERKKREAANDQINFTFNKNYYQKSIKT